jgi:arylsulfatase A-like enzyme
LDDVVVQDFYPDNETIRGDLADYAIEVEWFDTHIGRALTMLEERGMLENTLVIATSDHGMPFPRIKGQIYDEGFRVPLAVRWGAKIKPGRVVTDFVTFPDVAPTIMGAVGLDPHDQMTGASFLYALLSEGEGRIDTTRDHTLLGKERHDIGRVDGDVFSVGYPARALRDDRFLYVRNFKPHRWPVGNPEYGYMNTDGSPTKSYLTNLDEGHPDYRYFELSFGKRPAEELYDIVEDPHCLANLATSAEYRNVKEAMRVRMEKGLIAQKDPRILGEGEIFDRYPNSRIDPQRKSYNNPDYNPVKDFEEWKKIQD